jgi:hypothetical protein
MLATAYLAILNGLSSWFSILALATLKRQTSSLKCSHVDGFVWGRMMLHSMKYFSRHIA